MRNGPLLAVVLAAVAAGLVVARHVAAPPEEGRSVDAGGSADAAAASERQEVVEERRTHLVRPDPGRDPSPVRVVRVWTRDGVLEADVLQEKMDEWGGLPVSPGDRCLLDESRAVAAVIEFPRDFAPRDVPVLRADDDRLDPLVFEVRDAETGDPIPTASLHLLPMAGSSERRIVSADSEGRIAAPGGGLAWSAGQRLLARLRRSGSCVRAPGYVSHSWGPWFPFHGGRPEDHPVSASDLASIAERGVVSVRLRRAEAGVAERTATLLDEDGETLSGVTVLLSGALRPEERPPGAANAWSDAPQLTAVDGTFRVPRVPVLAVEARIGPFPVAVFALDTRGDYPLDLRLPPIVRAYVTVEDVPRTGAHWTLNPFDRALTPADGPLLPPSYGPGVERTLAENEAAIGCTDFDAAGEIAAGSSEVRLFVPLGVPRTLWIGEGPWPPPGSLEAPRKVLTILALRSGPLEIRTRWRDLAVER